VDEFQDTTSDNTALLRTTRREAPECVLRGRRGPIDLPLARRRLSQRPSASATSIPMRCDPARTDYRSTQAILDAAQQVHRAQRPRTPELSPVGQGHTHHTPRSVQRRRRSAILVETISTMVAKGQAKQRFSIMYRTNRNRAWWKTPLSRRDALPAGRGNAVLRPPRSQGCAGLPTPDPSAQRSGALCIINVPARIGPRRGDVGCTCEGNRQSRSNPARTQRSSWAGKKHQPAH